MADMVERLSINFPMMRTYTAPDGPFVSYSDYADLRTQLDEARKALKSEQQIADDRDQAFEESAQYHDDLRAQHEACEYESDHHDLMAMLHRQFAASIRQRKSSCRSALEKEER